MKHSVAVNDLSQLRCEQLDSLGPTTDVEPTGVWIIRMLRYGVQE